MNHADGKEVAEVMTDFVNAYSYDKARFVEQVQRSHRTLQQSLFGLMLSCMKAWAEAENSGRYDLRNEYTVQTSAKIMALVDGFDSVPCI